MKKLKDFEFIHSKVLDFKKSEKEMEFHFSQVYNLTERAIQKLNLIIRNWKTFTSKIQFQETPSSERVEELRFDIFTEVCVKTTEKNKLILEGYLKERGWLIYVFEDFEYEVK